MLTLCLLGLIVAFIIGVLIATILFSEKIDPNDENF